jgi:hypothetical protein
LQGGDTVTLGQNLSTKGPGNSLSLTESFSCKLAYDGSVSIEDLLDTASDIQDLVSIATDRSAQYGSVQASPLILWTFTVVGSSPCGRHGQPCEKKG